MQQCCRAFLVILLMRCAGQEAPSGGPVDETPPEVVATVPENGAVNAALDTKVELHFSEKIDRDTFEPSFFISPEPRGGFKIKHKGKRAIISFPDGLLDERTYVLTVGTGVKDAHNVAMASAFTLAFATGDSLDRGEISGRVFDARAHGLTVWAYQLSGDPGVDFRPDSLPPDYKTQTGKTGRFQLQYIATGNYRVIVVDDALADGIYQPMQDRIGLPTRDIRIEPGSLRAGGLRYRMMRADTLAPSLGGAVLRSANLVEFRFTEAVNMSADSLRSLIAFESEADLPEIRELVHLPQNRAVWQAHISPYTLADSLFLTVDSVADFAGQLGRELRSAIAMTDDRSDTTAPRLQELAPRDSSLHLPVDSKFIITFSEWMQRSPVTIALADTNGTQFAGKTTWQSPFSLTFEPDTLLPAKTPLRLAFDKRRLRDLAGNTLFDTTAFRRFTTVNPDTFGSIQGMINIVDDALAQSPVILEAALQGKLARQYPLRRLGSGPYEFANVMPGLYSLQGFLDPDSNAVYDFGAIRPYRPSDVFFVYADTIKVRSRWPNEGNNITISR